MLLDRGFEVRSLGLSPKEQPDVLPGVPRAPQPRSARGLLHIYSRDRPSGSKALSQAESALRHAHGAEGQRGTSAESRPLRHGDRCRGCGKRQPGAQRGTFQLPVRRAAQHAQMPVQGINQPALEAAVWSGTILRGEAPWHQTARPPHPPSLQFVLPSVGNKLSPRFLSTAVVCFT